LTTFDDPHSRPLFPRGPGLGFRTFFLIVLCLVLMVVDARGNSLALVRNTASVLAQPAVWLASLPDTIRGMKDYFRWRNSLIAENHQLHELQLEQEVRLQRMDSLEAENLRIRELLGSAKQLQYPVQIAEIIGANQDPYTFQVTLNRGSHDQVYVGQPLIDATGVMGQVTQVMPDSSIALLITDPNTGIPVEINRTGLQTVANGSGDGHTLILPFLQANADIQPGDLLVSSALGGRFPPGYPVARVQSLHRTEGGNFIEAEAWPTAQLNRSRMALLVAKPQAAPVEAGDGTAANATAGETAATPADQKTAGDQKPAASPAAAKPAPNKPAAQPKPAAKPVPQNGTGAQQ